MSQPITHVDPDVAAKFSSFLEQNPSELELAPTNPNLKDQAISQPEEERPEEEAAPPEVEADAEADDSEEVEASQEDGTEDDQQSEPEGDDEGDIQTVAELAGILGDDVDEDALLDLQVDGREGEKIALRDALEAYRNGPSEEAHVAARIEAARSEMKVEHDQRIADLEKMTAGMIAYTQSEFSDVNWQELRMNDPEEYIRMSEKRDQAQATIRKSIETLEEEGKRREEQQASHHEGWVAEQVSTLHRLHPEWKTPEIGAAAMKDVQQYLVQAGFPKEQMEALEDALSINTVWEAAQYRKLQASKPGIRKRLRSLPRTLRATARAAEAAPQEAQLKQHAAKVSAHREQNSVESAAKLFEELM